MPEATFNGLTQVGGRLFQEADLKLAMTGVLEVGEDAQDEDQGENDPNPYFEA